MVDEYSTERFMADLQPTTKLELKEEMRRTSRLHILNFPKASHSPKKHNASDFTINLFQLNKISYILPILLLEVLENQNT